MIVIIEKDNNAHHNKFKYNAISNQVLLLSPKSFATNKKGKKSILAKLNISQFVISEHTFFILRYNDITLHNIKWMETSLFGFYQTYFRCVQVIA